MTKNKSLYKLILLVVAFLLLGVTVIVVGAFLLFRYIKYDILTVDWATAVQHHTVPENPHFQELWTQRIFAGCMTCVIAAESSVYFVGTLQDGAPMSLTCLDLLTGEVQWQTVLPSVNVSLLTYDSQYIFVSVSGGKVASPGQLLSTARVVAYDRLSGKQVWSQPIPGTRSVGPAYIIDETVFVFSDYDRSFQLTSETGKILDETRRGLLASYDENTNYFLEFNGIRALSSKTGESRWFQRLPVYPPPQFVEEIIIMGGGERNLLGSVIALDRQSGNALWENKKVISSIAANNSTVFFLKIDENGVWGSEYVSDAQLLAVDIETGVVAAEMQFSPPGLTSGSGKFLYNVAVHDNIVLVHLADGHQLIALRFSPGE